MLRRCLNFGHEGSIRATQHSTSSRTSWLIRNPHELWDAPSHMLWGRGATWGFCFFYCFKARQGLLDDGYGGAQRGLARSCQGFPLSCQMGRSPFTRRQPAHCGAWKAGRRWSGPLPSEHWHRLTLPSAFKVNSDIWLTAVLKVEGFIVSPFRQAACGSACPLPQPSLPFCSPSSPAAGKMLTKQPVSSSRMGLYFSLHVAVVLVIPAANVVFDLQ